MGGAHDVPHDPEADSSLMFESIEAPQPAPQPEPPPMVEPPPAPRITRARPAPAAAKAPEPSPAPAQPVAAAAAEPAPVQPTMPVATVDASVASASIAVPAAPPGARPAAPGVIAARAPASVKGPLTPGAINVDRSRRAGLADSARWDCPFPNEAESEGIESAKAVLRVEIDALGQPRNVVVTQDPGFGFGREARRCAMRRRWTSRLDRSGAPAADAVTVVVNFERS